MISTFNILLSRTIVPGENLQTTALSKGDAEIEVEGKKSVAGLWTQRYWHYSSRRVVDRRYVQRLGKQMSACVSVPTDLFNRWPILIQWVVEVRGRQPQDSTSPFLSWIKDHRWQPQDSDDSSISSSLLPVNLLHRQAGIKGCDQLRIWVGGEDRSCSLPAENSTQRHRDLVDPKSSPC